MSTNVQPVVPAKRIRELEYLPDIVALVQAPSLEILDINEHGARSLGWTAEEMIGKSLLHFGDPTRVNENGELIDLAREGMTVRFDRRVRTGDGSWRNVNFAVRMIDDGSGRFLLSGRELEALAHSRSRLAGLLQLADLTDDLFIVTDRVGTITYTNAAVGRMHGDVSFVGRNVTEFLHESNGGFPLLAKAIDAPDHRAEARVTARRADGSPIFLGVRTIFDPETELCFTVERDISDIVEAENRMRELNDDLRRRATTDTLTGVANRHALNEALTEAVELGEPFALMLLDMDDFKSVNDTLGHAAGDEFLRCVAQRLQRAVKLTDLVARLGGDEFVVYLPGVDRSTAASIADRMIAAVGRNYSIGGVDLVRSCSIGVAIYEAGDDESAVLSRADRAAYQAKHAGRSRYAIC